MTARKEDRLSTVLDRAISRIFPGWGVRRLRARALVSLLDRSATRSFTAGPPGRLSARSKDPRIGPREVVKRDMESTRAQARRLYRENPYARGVINTIKANLIGCGIRPQPRVMMPKKPAPDETFNDAVESLWKGWSDACDPSGRQNYYSQQAQLETEQYVTGESILLYSTPDDGRDVPFATEVIPSERVADLNEDRRGGTKIVQGVEIDAAGKVAAYWIYPNHPWETNFVSEKAQRIPAQRVRHYFDVIEPGQVRGLTRLHTIAGVFDGYLQWLDWLLTKERVASAFTLAILRNAQGLNTPISTGDASDETDDDGNDIDYLEGGIVAHLRPGESIEGVNSGVMASAVDVLAQVFLRVIARGLDLSYELVSRDLSNVTYLSARQGENQDRRHWEPQQEEQNRHVNLPVYREVLRVGHLVGKLPARELAARHFDVEFVRPGWPWIDPQKEINATKIALECGIESPIDVIMRRGGNPWKVLRDLATFKAWADEFGLNLSIFGGGANGATDQEDSDAESDPNYDNSADSKSKGSPGRAHADGRNPRGRSRHQGQNGRRLILK